MFGDNFWNNVMVEVTWFAYSPDSIRIRNEMPNEKSEEAFARKRMAEWKRSFNLTVF